MQQQASATYAAIDIGSNTIEMLIARCSPNNVEKLEHQTTMVRLGEDVDEKGEISPDKFKMALGVVQKYQKLAKKRGAKAILAIATEALREARSSQAFIEAVKRETGIEVQLISGYAEATLDFFGATCSTSELSNVGVLDVGGGSTEMVIGKDNSIVWLTSIPFGSGTIQDRYLPSDPPTRVEMEAARSYLARQLQMMHIQKPPTTLIVTGSSASSLLKLAGTAFKLDEQNDRLAFEELALCEGLLCAFPSKEIAERYEQRIERARILPAGDLIIQAVMQYFHLKEIHVSSHGVREGALLAYARHGQAWLQEVNGIASKWGTSPMDQNNTQMQAAQQQPFAEFGREILPKYAKKFLKWPDDVRKQEDIEAVHKMRVASRRLRATLDAFEACADPELFKKINTRVKKLADALGTVRDTDVMISGLSNYMQEIASEEQVGVQWLIDRLHSYHQQEEQVLDTELQKLDKDAIQQKIDDCIPKGAAQDGKS